MAVRTIQAVLDQARVLLQDLAPAVRYTDGQLLDAFNGGMEVVRRSRPDFFIGKPADWLPFYDATNLVDPFPLPPWMFQPLVFFVVGRSELRDDPYTNNSRAMGFTGALTAALLAP